MTQKLIGEIDPNELASVERILQLRFRDSKRFRVPEAVVLYEQGTMGFDAITKYCQTFYTEELQTPKVQFLPIDIINFFADQMVVPYKFDTVGGKIFVGVVPELIDKTLPRFKNKETVEVPVPLHWFVSNYSRVYASPNFLLPLPTADTLDLIVTEAISLGAADITISSDSNNSRVYFNVRKKKVYSKRSVKREEVDQIARFLAGKAGSTLTSFSRDPSYFSVDLDTHNRGRVTVVETIYGLNTTIRVLSNELFTTRLDDLNLKDNTVDFLRQHWMSLEKGLRIMVGPTYSGKNTTIASALFEVLEPDNLKAVSVEQPVELRLPNVEQINCETEEDYVLNTQSLVRQNPDLVYVTEITDRTATSILNIGNTGKVVITSVHANNLADVPSRLQDLTGYSLDRVILNIHCLIYQELIRNEEEDKVYPVNKCIYFSRELKRQLFGKSLGDITKILMEEEDRWTDC